MTKKLKRCVSKVKKKSPKVNPFAVCKASFNKKELKIGTRIEMEHTSSKKRAEKIAKDHLREFPRYYTKGLIPMEKKLKRRVK